MSTAHPQPRMRTMSAIRRPTSTSSNTSSSARSRTSMGGPGSEQTTPRSSLSSSRPRSSLSMIERPSILSARGGLEQSASGMARPSPLSSSRPLPPAGRSTSGTKRGSPIPNGERGESPGSTEMLENALRREVEEKEELMLRLANKDEAIAQLEARIVEMDTTMTQGESRLSELYADQERWEAERAALEKEITKKTTVIDKLRIQLRELEKENRDYTRRLTEQAAQFESERQAFYDNTAHLKSRIQSLTDQQRDWKERRREEAEELQDDEEELGAELGEQGEPATAQTDEPVAARSARRPFLQMQRRESVAGGEPEEPPEMTALRLELSTLSTSHGSLGQTVKMLQGQLADLQRVNMSLQEENEAFTTLLREKTLSGQMNILRRGSRSPSPTRSSDAGEKEEQEETGLLSPVESRPPRVRTHSRAVKPFRNGSPTRSVHSGKSGRSARRVAAETLADLPVAGPGLDLAAELGRAEIRLEDDLGQGREPEGAESKQEEQVAKVSNAELDGLKAEVKQLKEENKALALYASKIIDRIISQEGFEHILAVDYGKPKEKEKEKPAPPPAQPRSFLMRAASLSISSPTPPNLTGRPPLKISTDTAPAAGIDSPGTPMGKRERRGLSMDWSRLNPWAKAPSTPVEDVRTTGLKPLSLGRTRSSTGTDGKVVLGARKLDNQEDEEDRIERERLDAEMKLMGIERTPNIHTPSAGATSFAAAGSALAGSDSGVNRPGAASGTSTPLLGGIVGWGKRPGSVRQDSGGRVSAGELRAEHLELGDSPHSTEFEVREVESRLAALEEREKHLSAELAKGKGGGFTEPPAKGARVRRRASSGSGASTLFSAGRVSRGGSEIGIGEEPEQE